jgi:hypothetical protein
MIESPIVTFQQSRSISLCACCDGAICDAQMVVVIFPGSNRVEDYCLACYDVIIGRR